MKKIITLFSFLITALLVFSQPQPPPTTCPTIAFSYDASGNRIQRSLVVVDCSQLQRTQNSTANNPTVSNFPISVYPNPTQDKINIGLEADSLSQSSTIQLYDLNGKIVYSIVASSLQMQIDMLPLGAGTYILKVTRGKNFATYNIKKT